MRRGALTALVTVAALAAAGCAKGTEQQAYETPTELCGITVDPAALRPVLVPGKEATTRVASASGGAGCAVLVDGRNVLALENTTAPANEDYRATWNWQMPHGTPVRIGDEGRAADTLVSAARTCTVAGVKRTFVSRAERFSTQGGDAAARKEALTRFMAAYFPAAARKAGGCTA